MDAGYLDNLDSLLALGLDGFSPQLLARQGAFVRAQQCADGGFPGRQGGSDLYYTDFAVRVLALCDRADGALARVAPYLAPYQPRDIVEGFCLLNAARVLRQCGIDVLVDRDAVAAAMASQRVPGGGYGPPGRPITSAYHTFLAALCCEMLGQPVPEGAQAAAAMAGLAAGGGGYCDRAGETVGQTSATAGAVAVLLMHGALPEGGTDHAAAFLAKIQAGDGGLQAHPAVPVGDLLSTFTGMLTLFGLDALDRLDLSALGRFVRGCAAPTGGFRACPADEEPDIEYTYYGLGALAVLRAYLAAAT